jgi:dephospho-CoA kinase
MKAVILGLSGVGKSTIANVLKDKYALPILEVDDVVKDMKQENRIGSIKVSEIFEMTNEKVLGMDNVIYVTSKLLPERIEQFYDAGFKIIELHASYETIISRLKNRDNIDKHEIENQKYKYKVYMERVDEPSIQKCFALRLDTTAIKEKDILQKIGDVIIVN